MREYTSVTDNKTIATEVIETGSSKNWAAVNPNTLALAQELENSLAKFNIGYIDPKVGTWGPKRDGTRYFTTMKLMGVAKNKLTSMLANFKK